ncbi:hypothetical protein FZEAL_4561 [Fusarium zealandicum]|uniref:lanosterol synthase n=1 Tax=Fusarium zealandicum TaxID=1053134 RepID=A0A8H4UM06_9HYPO|nr:hypothetical protein FZEAL_4561 [Fusarium zealandicum]
MQDANTDYAGIAASDAPMNTIIYYFTDGPESTGFRRHIERLQEFLWITSDGMFVNSTNGSQCWDTAFLVQAVCHGGFQTEERWRPMLLKSYHFLERQQIQENGFVVSDYIAEGLRAIIPLEKRAQFLKIFDDQRLYDAVDSMMVYQNETGGASAFEAKRGGDFPEKLNMTEIFGRRMVEYDYPECTLACATALCLFRQYWPHYRKSDVDKFIRRGVAWIKKNQRPDGSWYGSWGICFTYATMFALEGLASVEEYYHASKTAKRACDFLISKQPEDGGWSKSFESCLKLEYREDPAGSLVVQTAWALIGLIEAKYPDPKPIARAARFLMSRQQSNGEWLKEAIPKSFHGFCTFSYPNYKFVFTIKELGLVATRYPDLKLPLPC